MIEEILPFLSGKDKEEECEEDAENQDDESDASNETSPQCHKKQGPMKSLIAESIPDIRNYVRREIALAVKSEVDSILQELERKSPAKKQRISSQPTPY
jgi:hypothetical protein